MQFFGMPKILEFPDQEYAASQSHNQNLTDPIILLQLYNEK